MRFYECKTFSESLAQPDKHHRVGFLSCHHCPLAVVLLAQCFKYRAWFKHTFLFGSLAFSYFLERVDFSYVHTNLSRCCSLQYFFHPEVGKPVSSIYTSPQASGKRRILTSFSVYPINTTFSFNFFTSTPFVTRRSFIQLTRAKKPLSALISVDMYLTSASQSQLDDLCNGALMNSHTLRSSQISSLAADWPSKLRWFVSKRDQSCSTNFFKVKGALN